jgi:hypothetical protein
MVQPVDKPFSGFGMRYILAGPVILPDECGGRHMLGEPQGTGPAFPYGKRCMAYRVIFCAEHFADIGATAARTCLIGNGFHKPGKETSILPYFKKQPGTEKASGKQFFNGPETAAICRNFSTRLKNRVLAGMVKYSEKNAKFQLKIKDCFSPGKHLCLI